MKHILLFIIYSYQKLEPTRKVIFSSLFPFYSSCRYLPTCSDYACQVIKKYGAAKGSYLSLRRILSCNPWGGKGYHPTSQT